MITEVCACPVPQDAGFWAHDRFMARGDCGLWGEGMASLYAWSNIAIFLAYVAIPAILIMAHIHDKQRGVKDVSLSEGDIDQLRVAAGLFVFFCGMGHLEGAIAFLTPYYHLFAVWHFVTAVVSWWAAAVIYRHRAKLIIGF